MAEQPKETLNRATLPSGNKEGFLRAEQDKTWHLDKEDWILILLVLGAISLAIWVGLQTF
jgi:hypothetical protein